MTARSPFFDRTGDFLHYGGQANISEYNLFASGQAPDYFIALLGNVDTTEFVFPGINNS